MKSRFKTLNGSARLLMVDGIVTKPRAWRAWKLRFPRSFLVGLDADPMVYSRSEALLAAQMLFGCLYADMAQQELDLFQLAACFMT